VYLFHREVLISDTGALTTCPYCNAWEAQTDKVRWLGGCFPCFCLCYPDRQSPMGHDNPESPSPSPLLQRPPDAEESAPRKNRQTWGSYGVLVKQSRAHGHHSGALPKPELLWLPD
jgi:hypothetical protein